MKQIIRELKHYIDISTSQRDLELTANEIPNLDIDENEKTYLYQILRAKLGNSTLDP